jgi:hypothetical protein
MKTTFMLIHLAHAARLCRVFVVVAVVASVIAASGQGTITFNGAAYFSGTNYYEAGMWFHVIIPTPGDYDRLGVLPAITVPSNVPYNSTPYMIFFQDLSPDDYVVLSLTNGYTFGLTSVNLADPNSPSLSPVSISFIGSLAGGSMVTNTFTTPGNGATNLLNYSFNSAFVSGLTSVEIHSTRWAMDNLVFGNVAPVPEPYTESLLTVGLLVWSGWMLRKRRAA